MAGLSCLPEFEGITLEEPTVFNKFARQGGMEEHLPVELCDVHVLRCLGTHVE